MALVEAMKCRVVPIVAGLEAGVPEIIDHGITGLITVPGDVAAMASAIVSLSRDPSLLDSIADAARRSASSRFPSGDVAETMTRAIFSAKPPAGKDDSPRYLSRLDRTWIPNGVVRMARHAAAVGRQR
jgi:glycosyltransferase involved in cell wall biosynthesis